MKTIAYGLFIYVSLTTIYCISAKTTIAKGDTNPPHIKSKCDLPNLIKKSKYLKRCINITPESIKSLSDVEIENLSVHLCTAIFETANKICEMKPNFIPVNSTTMFEAKILELETLSKNLPKLCTALNETILSQTYKASINASLHIRKLNEAINESCDKICWEKITDTTANPLCSVLLWGNKILAGNIITENPVSKSIKPQKNNHSISPNATLSSSENPLSSQIKNTEHRNFMPEPHNVDIAINSRKKLPSSETNEQQGVPSDVTNGATDKDKLATNGQSDDEKKTEKVKLAVTDETRADTQAEIPENTANGAIDKNKPETNGQRDDEKKTEKVKLAVTDETRGDTQAEIPENTADGAIDKNKPETNGQRDDEREKEKVKSVVNDETRGDTQAEIPENTATDLESQEKPPTGGEIDKILENKVADDRKPISDDGGENKDDDIELENGTDDDDSKPYDQQQDIEPKGSDTVDPTLGTSKKKNENPRVHTDKENNSGQLGLKINSGQGEKAPTGEEDIAPVEHDIPYPGPPDPPQHFFAYFMAVSFICLVCYIGYHKKHKIMGIIFEGRKSRGGRGRRRPNTAGYRKLDCNLEEAVTSQCNSNVTHVIY